MYFNGSRKCVWIGSVGFLREEQGQFPLPRPSGFPPRNFLFILSFVLSFFLSCFLSFSPVCRDSVHSVFFLSFVHLFTQLRSFSSFIRTLYSLCISVRVSESSTLMGPRRTLADTGYRLTGSKLGREPNHVHVCIKCTEKKTKNEARTYFLRSHVESRSHNPPGSRSSVT